MAASSRTEFPVEAMAHLCQTPEFQVMVMDILKAVIPEDSRELQDIRNILFEWNCANPQVMHTNAVTEPGIPVVLMPFVLQHVPPRDTTDPDFLLISCANKMLYQIHATLNDLPGDITLESITPKAEQDPLVKAAKEFVMAYVCYTHSDADSMSGVILQILPALDDLAEETRPERVRIFRKINALFYGLHGYCLTREILEQMLNQNSAVPMEQMQALHLGV